MRGVARPDAGWARWLQFFLVTVGVAACGYYGLVWLDTTVQQDYESFAFERDLAGEDATWRGYAQDRLRHVLHREETPDDGETAKPAQDKKSAGAVEKRPPALERNAGPLRRGDRLGRVVISRLRVNAMVREGSDARTLRRAVGHIPGTALPGQQGNVGLAGHRDSFFLGLRDVRKGDIVTVETLQGSFQYEVESTQIVTPKDVYVLKASAEPTLTLVTCYPFNFVGSAPKRFIVKAREVSREPEAQQASTGG